MKQLPCCGTELNVAGIHCLTTRTTPMIVLVIWIAAILLCVSVVVALA